MKKLSLVLFAGLMLLCSSAVGQVTISFSDFPYTPGSVMTRSMGSNFNLMTAGGPNQTWDFSASVTVLDFIENFDDPTGHPGADSFPTATHVMFGPEVQEFQQLTYFRYQGSTWAMLGGTFVFGENVIAIPAELTGVNADFPIQYGDEWDFVSVTDYDDVETTVEAHHHADAWGTVTDVNGTFECLRIRIDRTTTEVPGEVESHVEYYWYAQDYGEVAAAVSNNGETEPLFESGSFMRINDIQTGINESDPAVLSTFTLMPAYPNPFNASTTLQFTLANPSDISLALLNTLGQQVSVVTNGSFAPGTHQVALDGGGLASGTYFVRLVASGQQTQLQRITLVK
jgi:Secretion system C-terminal sorting domain